MFSGSALKLKGLLGLKLKTFNTISGSQANKQQAAAREKRAISKSAEDRKSAYESMAKAGIKNLSGGVTDDKKGRQAEQK